MKNTNKNIHVVHLSSDVFTMLQNVHLDIMGVPCKTLDEKVRLLLYSCASR